MMNRELALRFSAFLNFDQDVYRQFSSLDAFLSDFTKRIDERPASGSSFTANELIDMRQKFALAMENVIFVLDKFAFRRNPSGASKRGPINRAVFEAQATALAKFPTAVLVARKESVRQKLLSLFDEDEYVRSVTVGTGDWRRVSHRLNRTHEAVCEALA